MTCKSCGDKPKKCDKDFTRTVVEIDNPEQITLMRKVTVPASMGDDTTMPPVVGKYHNVLLNYEANNKTYLYSSDGIPVQLNNGVTDYEAAVNLPQINGHTLLGNQTGPELGLQNTLSVTPDTGLKLENNVLSGLPATDTTIGMVKPSTGLEIDTDGTLIVIDHVFDTVADMKAAANLIDGDYAQTLGYYAVNDNGSAIYRISSTQPSTYYETLDSGLYAMIVTDKKVRPEMFGAYGDGTHDDAPIIRQTMSYISSKGGGTIELSNEKVYLLNSLDDPSVNVTTFFNVPDNTTICGSGTLKIADNFGDYDNIFRPTTALTRLEFRDFTIDDNTTGNPILDTTGGTEGHHRTGFRLIAQPTEQIIIDGITFNDCAGVWQIIMQKAIFSEVSNVTVNFTTAGSPSYDRTSIFFEAQHGSVHDCVLHGNNKSGTAIELHGIDNELYNSYIEGYLSGIYMTNECRVDIDLRKQETYSNTVMVRKTGIKYWMTQDNIYTDLISIHDNLVIVEGSTGPGPMGIGLHTTMADGARVKDLMVNNNSIIMKNNYNNESIPLSFSYSSSTNSSTIDNLVIRDNLISGNGKYAIELKSQADDTLKILNTTVDGNEFNISEAATLFHVVAYSGFNYIFFTNNIIRSSSIERLYGIFGSPTCQTFISGNNCDKKLAANNIARDSATEVKVNHENVELDSGTTFNALPSGVLDGSTFKTDKYFCVKSDGKWTVNCSSESMPTHRWFGKGSVINLTNDTDIMAIAKKDGYVGDHDVSTGDHKVGDWVEYGSYVWYCKEDNTYTDNPSSHPDDFQYIGELCTFYTISAT
jgi:hypothetical protein